MSILNTRLSPMEIIEYNEKRPKFIREFIDQLKVRIAEDQTIDTGGNTLGLTAGGIHIGNYLCSYVDNDAFIHNSFEVRFCKLGENLRDIPPEFTLSVDLARKLWVNEDGSTFSNSALVDQLINRLRELSQLEV